MQKEKLQHYSIRKLSVGAASVLIGLSFVGLSQTSQVKADTTSPDAQVVQQDQQTEQGKNDVEQKQAPKQTEEVEKQNVATTTNNQQNPETQSTSDNSNADNSKQDEATNTFNVSKVSKDHVLSRDALKESKSEASNQLPAFGSRSLDDRAPGTRHTRVGDTRLSEDQTKHMAISSDIQLTNDQINESNKTIRASVLTDVVGAGLKGTATIDKNDIKAGNKILLGTIQISNDRYGQDFINQTVPNSETVYTENHSPLHTSPIDFNGKHVGDITIENSDLAEMDVWLNVSNTQNYASNPTISFNNIETVQMTFKGNFLPVKGMKVGQDFNVQYDTGNNHKYDFQFYDNVPLNKNYSDLNFSYDPHVAGYDSWRTLHWYLNWPKNFLNVDNQNNLNTNNVIPKDNAEVDIAFKLTPVQGNLIGFTNSVIRGELSYIDENGKAFRYTNSSNLMYANVLPLEQLSDGLTSKEILDQTTKGNLRWSKQSDGSIILGMKLTPDMTKINANDLQKRIDTLPSTGYMTLDDGSDPNKASKIIQNTKDFYTAHPYCNGDSDLYVGIISDLSKPSALNVTDVTPRNYSKYTIPTLEAVTLSDGANGGSFNAELYRNVKVNYVDDDNSGSIINTDSITGRKNQGADYTINIPTGYVLASGNADGTNYRWNNGRTGLTYTFAEDQKQNDQNPVTIHLSHGRKEVVDTHVIAETIHYQYEDGSKAANDYEAKHVASSRLGHKDLVTGKTVWDGDWLQETFPEVASPKINGYTADPIKVDAQTVDGTSEDVVKTVVYKANDQNIIVNYIDDNATDPSKSTLQSKHLVGKSNTTDDYTTGDAIKDYLSKGYDLVSDETNGKKLKYDADDDKDQIYAVHLKHHISDVTDPAMLTATFDRVITEKLPSGKNKQITQHYEVHRTGTQDQVTHAYTFGNWSTAQVHEDKGDKLDGYTARISNQSLAGLAEVKDGVPTVKAETFSGVNNGSTTPINAREEIEVSYDANTQKATINFIDDDAQEGTNSVLQSKALTGKSNTKASYDTGADIEKYLNQGYLLVSDDTQGNPITFDEKDNEDQVFAVHLKHNIVKVTDPRILNATFDRVITEKLPNGQQKQITQHYVITRKGKQDQVTKQYTFKNWTVTDVHEDKGDSFDGYTAQIKNARPDYFITIENGVPVAKAEQFTNENGKLLPQNLNEVAEIDYVANPQKATIDYIDDTTGKTLKTTVANGHFNENIVFDPSVTNTIDDYIKQGYVLVSNDFNGQKYVSNDAKNVFAVHLKHGTIDVSQSKDVTETIHYRYADGTKAADDVVVIKTFTEHGTKDLVTGAISWDGWTPASDTFAQVDSPVINGYTPDKASISAQKVTGDSPDLEFTVTYSKTPDPEPVDDMPVEPTAPEPTPVTPSVPDNDPVAPSKPKSKAKVKAAPKMIKRTEYKHYVAEQAKIQKPKAAKLPQTGENDEDELGLVGLALAGVVSMFGYSIKKREN